MLSGYNMESIYNIHNGMVQNTPVDEASQVNPAQLNQILAAVGYSHPGQQNMMAGGLYVPQQQQLSMSDYEYQQQARSLRPAAIPIKAPPGTYTCNFVLSSHCMYTYAERNHMK
jgi:hypothetical protein